MQKTMYIFTSYAYWPRLETELEIIHQYLEKDYKISVIYCDSSLYTCPDNTQKVKTKCLTCKSRFINGIKLIENDNLKIIPLVLNLKSSAIFAQKTKNIEFSSWEDLRNYSFDGIDFGESAYSEMITQLKDTNPKFSKYRNWANNLLKNSIMTYLFFKDLFDSEKPDLFILFNGRISPYRSVFRLAKKLKLNTKVFELGFFNNTYLFFENLASDISGHERQLLKVYNKHKNLDSIKKIEITNKFFNDRIKGNSNTILFNDLQKLKKLNLDSSKKVVSIFNSSDTEFIGIPENKVDVYENQNQAIEKILDYYNKNESILFILRIHPNLRSTNNTQIREIKNFQKKYDNLIVIQPESSIDSYELIKQSHLILVFGSTVGIESIFLGKDTLLFGKSMYSTFGGTINPKNYIELYYYISNILFNRSEIESKLPNDKDKFNAAAIYAIAMTFIGIEVKKQKAPHPSRVTPFLLNSEQITIKPKLVLRIFNLPYSFSMFTKVVFRKLHSSILSIVLDLKSALERI